MLCARRPRDRLHREGDDPLRPEALDALHVAQGLQEADQDGAGGQARPRPARACRRGRSRAVRRGLGRDELGPASRYALSVNRADVPAPRSTASSKPEAMSFVTASGVRATRCSPGADLGARTPRIRR